MSDLYFPVKSNSAYISSAIIIMLYFLATLAKPLRFPWVVPEGLLGELRIKSLLTDLSFLQDSSRSSGLRCQLLSTDALIQ